MSQHDVSEYLVFLCYHLGIIYDRLLFISETKELQFECFNIVFFPFAVLALSTSDLLSSPSMGRFCSLLWFVTYSDNLAVA